MSVFQIVLQSLLESSVSFSLSVFLSGNSATSGFTVVGPCVINCTLTFPTLAFASVVVGHGAEVCRRPVT